jgi:hypothetical protein
MRKPNSEGEGCVERLACAWIGTFLYADVYRLTRPIEVTAINAPGNTSLCACLMLKDGNHDPVPLIEAEARMAELAAHDAGAGAVHPVR